MSPVQFRLLTVLAAVSLVVWKDLLAPVVTGIACDDHLTVLVLELLIVRTNRVEDHMAKKIFFNLSIGVVAKLNHQIGNHHL